MPNSDLVESNDQSRVYGVWLLSCWVHRLRRTERFISVLESHVLSHIFKWSGEGVVTVHEVVPKKKTSGGSDFCFVKGANAFANHESND